MSTGLAVSLSLLVDVALVGLLVHRSRRPVGLPRLLVVLVLGLLCVLAQGTYVALALGRWNLSIHFAHAFVFFVLPAFGLALALGRPWAGTRAVRATTATGVLVLAAIGIDSSFIEPRRLITETVSVPIRPERAGRDELTIGVLADIQCDSVTEHERQAIARVMAARPDLIVLPGDVMQPGGARAAAALAPTMRALLSELHAPLGVFCVPGDTDTVEGLTELLAGTDVRLLCNEIVELEHGDRRIRLGGVVRDPTNPVGRGVVQRLAAPGGDDLRLLLAHKPDWALLQPEGGRIDLVVTGHTHGGQVQLPFIGPLITLTQIPRAMAAGGLHTLCGSPLYVSRGVGFERGDAPRVRFNCPPEISLLTLVTAGPAAPAADSP